MSELLKIEDFREFTDSDWHSYAGANEADGTPLIYDGPSLSYTIIVDSTAIGLYFYDCPEEYINGMIKQVASLKVGTRMVELIRWPDIGEDDIEDLELLGFDFV